MTPWLVFKQDSSRKPHQMVGSVNAADGEMALLQARSVFARRPKAISLWVAPEASTLTITAEELAADQLPDPPADQQPPTDWYVMRKVGNRRSMTFVDHIGAVSAASAADAMHKAIATYADDKETTVWMVVPEAAIVRSSADDIPSWFEPALSKTYKQQSAYGFVSPTRPSRTRNSVTNDTP